MKEWILPTVGTFICWGLWGFIPKITTKYYQTGIRYYFRRSGCRFGIYLYIENRANLK